MPHLWFRVPHFEALAPTPAPGIVVERSSVRGFAADCPIYAILKPSRRGIFHPYVVAGIALRGSQQLRESLLYIVSNIPSYIICKNYSKYNLTRSNIKASNRIKASKGNIANFNHSVITSLRIIYE